MKENKELSDLPIEVVYKYLLRDYRALQHENKELEKEIRMLIEARFDEINPDSEEEIVRITDKYKLWGKSKLIQEIGRLIQELRKYTS
jgi:hypothetical protein